MTSHIALLRGINVGGRNRVAMAELRELLGELGLEDVRTLLQSGNVVFRGGKKRGAALERVLERATHTRFDAEIDWFVRDAAEWDELVAANPFEREARTDPSHLVVLFLREAPSAARVAELVDAIRGRERVRAVGRQLYAVYPDGIGTSKLTNAVIDRALGARSTARNWNTVTKLAVLAR